ncbi:g7570 [Coccomyxa elongata]
MSEPSYSSPRDSYLNIQNVESLTRELAEVGEDLERLAVSESEVSEQDYKRLEEARRQHEDELKARRELRAARRKASQAKAAAERAAASAGASVATNSTVTRERTLSGAQAQSRGAEGSAAAAVSSSGAAARGAKAATVKARAAADRKLSGARATAAARTRTHTAWGKRHVEKAGKDAFQRPTQVSSAGATNTTLYNATKMQGFGQQSLLTAAEEKVLSNAVQRLIALEAVQAEAVERLGRPVSEKEWMAECGQTSIHAFRKAIKAGNDARTRMMKSNERLVFHVARRYMNRGLDFQDLIAEGMSGLWRGVEKFDASRGFKFSTYAHWWVRQAITRAISEQGRVVRLPVHLHELMAKVTKVDLEYQAEHGHRAGKEKLAELVGISTEKLAMLSKVYKSPTSFNAPVGNSADPGADTVGESIADDTEASPEEVAVRLNLHADMDNVLATLTTREAGILRSRYGLDDGRQRTLEEVGQIFKVTRERIRQIEAKAILKLRQPDRSSILNDYVHGAQTQSVNWRAARSKCHS